MSGFSTPMPDPGGPMWVIPERETRGWVTPGVFPQVGAEVKVLLMGDGGEHLGTFAGAVDGVVLIDIESGPLGQIHFNRETIPWHAVRYIRDLTPRAREAQPAEDVQP